MKPLNNSRPNSHVGGILLGTFGQESSSYEISERYEGNIESKLPVLINYEADQVYVRNTATENPIYHVTESQYEVSESKFETPDNQLKSSRVL